jgi:MinD superfamily P-loop ATPase
MSDDFVIAVASGKGGTGKTTIATNLAYAVSALDRKVQYLDCDVEEPNGHIFLKPHITCMQEITVDVPQIDPKKCTACGKCGEICQYGAIVCIKEGPHFAEKSQNGNPGHVLIFEQLCHSCGGCFRICPTNAIKAKPLKIGDIEFGKADEIEFVSGKLQIGNVRTPTLIKEVKKQIKQDSLVIIDVPPGTSCPVVEAVKGVDFVLLVTEPTPFGLNDLKLAVELMHEMNLPFAVVINRYGIGNEEVEKYCEAENIDVIIKLPDDRLIAEAYSSGQMIVDVLQEYIEHFSILRDYLEGVKGKLDEKRRLRIRRKNNP